jgi:hypothetical protein
MIHCSVGLEVLTAVVMNIAMFWNIASVHIAVSGATSQKLTTFIYYKFLL